MQIFKDQFCDIVVDTPTSTMEITWLAQPEMDYFPECLKRCIGIAEKYKIKFVLADNLIGVQLDMATQRCIIENAAGIENLLIEKYARVIPMDVFQEMVSYKIADQTLGLLEGKTKFKVFSSKSVARTWLQAPSDESEIDLAELTDSSE